jgi:hypothetical protein
MTPIILANCAWETWTDSLSLRMSRTKRCEPPPSGCLRVPPSGGPFRAVKKLRKNPGVIIDMFYMDRISLWLIEYLEVLNDG